MNLLRYFEHDKKLLIKVIAGVILLAVAFAFYLVKEAAAEQAEEIMVVPDEPAANVLVTTNAAIAEEKPVVMVDVAGAVNQPSVVELPEGSRVFEAIEKAGGLTGDADLSMTNQAEILTDGQKIYIPTKHELQESQAGSPPAGMKAYSSGAAQSKLININTADSQTLQQLKGVGPATAEKIIDYRNENGKFKTIEDLKNVSGIGDKTFEKLKDKITIS